MKSNLSTEQLKLAKQWCELNRWKIPREFKNVVFKDDLYSIQKEMKKIEKVIGIKACLSEWESQVFKRKVMAQSKRAKNV